MTLIVRHDSRNAWCPKCHVTFGTNFQGDVECPTCKTVQARPIIQIGEHMFYCASCAVQFGAPPNTTPRCHRCGSERMGAA